MTDDLSLTIVALGSQMVPGPAEIVPFGMGCSGLDVRSVRPVNTRSGDIVVVQFSR